VAVRAEGLLRAAAGCKKLAQLKDMAWLGNSSLIRNFIEFISDYKEAGLPARQPLTISEELGSLLTLSLRKIEFAKYDKPLVESLLQLLMQFERGRYQFLELKKVYKILAEANTLTDDILLDLSLDNTELQQSRVNAQDIIVLRSLRSTLSSELSWEDTLKQLNDICTTGFSALNLVTRPEAFLTFLQTYKTNLKGTEERKRNDIFRILEDSHICFYQKKDQKEYSLYVFIMSNDEKRNFDMKESLDHNLDMDKKVILEESKSKQSNIVGYEDFISMQTKTSFILQFDKTSNQSKCEIFNRMAKWTTNILATINRIESEHLVVDLQLALRRCSNNMNEISYYGDRDSNFSSISVRIKDQSQGECSALKHLDEVAVKLEEECRRTKQKVFTVDRFKFYEWSCLQAHQIKLVEHYLQMHERRCPILFPDIQRKTRLLLQHADAAISLEIEDSVIRDRFKIHHENITYGLLENLSTVFEVEERVEREAIRYNRYSNTNANSFSQIRFDQENRIKALLDVIYSERVSKVRILFCCTYTKWNEIEVFLLRGLNDQDVNRYVIVDCHLLAVETRHRLLSELQNAAEQQTSFINYNLWLLVPAKHQSRVDEEVSNRYKQTFATRKLEEDDSWKNRINSVLLVKSDFAGLGKTFFIEKDAKDNGFKLLVLNLTGKMTPEVLNKRLEPIYQLLKEQNNKLALRVKIDITENVQDTFHYLDQLLFKICILKVIEFGSTYLGFESVQKFYIEVQKTLDGRLLDVDFIRFLANTELNCVTMQSPIKPKEDKESLPYDDPTRDNNIELIGGANQPDISRLLESGLTDALILHFLYNEGLIESARFDKNQKENLINYVNPNQIMHPVLKYVINRRLEELSQNTHSKEYKELLDLKDQLTSFSLPRMLTQIQDSIVQKAEELKKEIHTKLKRLDASIPSYLGYTTTYWTIKAIFSHEDLDAEVRKLELLKNSTCEELWLMLLIEIGVLFTCKYGNVNDSFLDYVEKSGDPSSVKFAKRNVKANVFSFIESLLDIKEGENIKLEDINYYHIQTLLKLTKQFVNQLNKAQNLDMSTWVKGGHRLKHGDVIAPTAFRHELTSRSMIQIRNFAFQQIVSVSSLQRQNHQLVKPKECEESLSYDQVMLEMRRKRQDEYHWFFLQDGVVKLVHNDDSKLDKDTTSFYYRQSTLKSQIRSLQAEKLQIEFIQEICEAFGSDKSPEAIKQMVRRIEIEIGTKSKRFMITPDNYLKIRLILQRAEVGIPIILLGESGCGKTFMIEFISEQLFTDGFEMMTFHSGVTEEEFSKLIIKCIEQAKENPKKRLWLFLDEINTTPLLPNIAELITERKAHFLESLDNSLPDNVVIVAACNPYQISQATQRDSRRLGENSLVHKVYPLPENLISYCFNYGQLSAKDEKTMIKTILEDAKMPKLTENVGPLTDCISSAQVLIRQYENDSAASLRDVRRFVNLLRTLETRKIWEFGDCLKLAFYCCYSIRIMPHEELKKSRRFSDFNDMEMQEGTRIKKNSFNEEVEQVLHKLGLSDSQLGLEAFFKHVSTALLAEAKSLDDKLKGEKKEGMEDQKTEKRKTQRTSSFEGIAVNRPLMENVFIMLHNFLARIPVYISGRPGTSKSVSIQVVESILNFKHEDKQSSKYFKDLPQAKFYPIWGSKETTAKQVEDVFGRVKEIAKRAEDSSKSEQNKDIKNTLRVIYFEEMGVADQNDNNPLKVLHPLLEPREKDTNNQICFVGLSNSVLDAAKLNRLLHVPRADMEENDLRATIDHYNIDSRLYHIMRTNGTNFTEGDLKFFQNKCKKSMKVSEDINSSEYINISEALVSSYREFRVYEQSNEVHKDFHGPRDFYTMCKWIDSYLFLIDEFYKENFEVKQTQVDFFCKTLSFFLLAIERSFSGREIHSSNLQFKIESNTKQKNCCFIFKEYFLKNLLTETSYKKLPERFLIMKNTPTRMISMNLCDPTARHLMIFVEGPFYVKAVEEAITNYQIKKEIKAEKIKFLNSEKQPIMNLLNDFISYISGGFTVIMRNMDSLYPSLYDLFNKRYIPDKSDKTKWLCQIAYGTTVNTVQVHEQFKCILIMDKPTPDDFTDAEDFESSWPTALLNRFEKHILTLEDLVEKDTFDLITQAKSSLENRQLPPDCYIHNWSKVLIESSVAKDASRKTIDLPVSDHIKAIKDQINENLELTGDMVLSKERDKNISKHAGTPSMILITDEKVENALNNLLDLYNSNYIYFLHRQYKKPEEKGKRDSLFSAFDRKQRERSIKDLILKHKHNLGEAGTNSKGLVAFSLSQPYETILRDLVDQEEELSAFKHQIAIVEYTAYSSLSLRFEQIQAIVKNPQFHTLIFQFKFSDEWIHLQEYESIIKDILRESNLNKLVILLAHNCSFDQQEIQKFRFPFIHFHSEFSPLSMDILGGDKSDYKKYYDLLDMKPLELLKNDQNGFMKDQLSIALTQEFITGKPFYEDDARISDMVNMIRERGLLGNTFVEVIRNSNNENNKEGSGDLFMNIDKPIVDIVEEMVGTGQIVDIIETMKKNILPMIHKLLMKTVRAVHRKCDLFFGLRLFKKYQDSISDPNNEKISSHEEMLKLWEQVAATARITNEKKDSADIMIYTDKDSRKNPHIFYRNLLKNNKKITVQSLDMDVAIQEAFNMYENTISNESSILSEDDLAGHFISSIKVDLLRHLNTNIVFSEVWKNAETCEVDNELLKNLFISMTSFLDERRASFEDVLEFMLPLIQFIENNQKKTIKFGQMFRLIVAVLVCLPEEVDWFAAVNDSLSSGLRLRLVPQMLEMKLSMIKSEGDQESKFENLAFLILEKMKKNDVETIKKFTQKLKNPKNTICDIKLEILNSSLESLFKIFFEQKNSIEEKVKSLEQATFEMKELLKIQPKIFKDSSSTDTKDYTTKWVQTNFKLLSIVRKKVFDNLKLTEYDSNTFFNAMVMDPIRVLAQFICENTYLKVEKMENLPDQVQVFSEIPILAKENFISFEESGKIGLIKKYSNCS
jgi:hypothetical protein